MELCTIQPLSKLCPNIIRQNTNPNLFSYSPKTSCSYLSLARRHSHSPLTIHSRSLVTRATESEGGESNGASYGGDGESIATLVEKEDPTPSSFVANEEPSLPITDEEQTQIFQFFEKLNIDTSDPYTLALYGGLALFVLWLSSAVVGAIEAIPVFPKLMELVGLGYTFWFTYRYLIFKSKREELFAKIDELKEEVIG